MVKRQVQIESSQLPESRDLLPQAHGEQDDDKGFQSSSSEASDPPTACASLPRCCCILFCILAVVVGILIAMVVTVNAWAGSALSGAAMHIFGVPTHVESVDIALFSARSSLKDVRIESPPGFNTDFLTLQTGVVDLKLWSLLQNPLEIQEISLHDLELFIDQRIDGDSNVKGIIENVNKVSHPKNPGARLMHTMTEKFIVDRISLTNITTRVCIHPLCDTLNPGYFVANRVQVSDLGKNTGGIYLYELVAVVVHALLLATLKASPVDISGQLSGALGNGFSQALGKIDYGHIQYDIGKGLKIAGQWTDHEFEFLGDGTKKFGDQAVGSVESAGHQATKSVDEALGLQHPTEPLGRSVKTLIDSESNVLTDAVATLVKNSTDVLSDGVDDIGQNVSSAVSGLGTVFGSMVKGLSGRLLRGHLA